MTLREIIHELSRCVSDRAVARSLKVLAMDSNEVLDYEIETHQAGEHVYEVVRAYLMPGTKVIFLEHE